jgi:zinc protease
MEVLSQSLNASLALPAEIDKQKGKELRYSGDPRWRTPAPAELAKWTFSEARAFFDLTLTKSPLEVIVVGDVSVDRAIDAVGKTVGALPSRRELLEPANARKMKFPAPTPTPIELHHKGRADQGLAVLAWPTEELDYAKPHNYLVGMVLEAILRERLLQRFRVQEGAIYAPSGEVVFSDIFIDYGYILLRVEIPPSKMTSFFSEADALAGDIAVNGVNDDQLMRARTPLVDQIKHEQRTNAYWLDRLTTAQSHPSSLAYYRTFVTNLESATAADIQAAAKKWLRKDTAWRLVIVPERSAPRGNDP